MTLPSAPDLWLPGTSPCWKQKAPVGARTRCFIEWVTQTLTRMLNTGYSRWSATAHPSPPTLLGRADRRRFGSRFHCGCGRVRKDVPGSDLASRIYTAMFGHPGPHAVRVRRAGSNGTSYDAEFWSDERRAWWPGDFTSDRLASGSLQSGPGNPHFLHDSCTRIPGSPSNRPI